MIYRVSKKISDENLLNRRKPVTSDRKPRCQPSKYSDVIVKKPWGYEYLAFENSFVAIWLLQIIRRRRTSMHCHPKKKTGLVLLCGNATHYHLDGTIQLNPLDAIIIEEGVFHSTEASSVLSMVPHSEDGIWVMEIESPPLKTDLVRAEDEYGRAGTSYEGLDNIVSGPKECLKFRVSQRHKAVRETFLDCLFTLRKGSFCGDEGLPNPSALVSIVGCDCVKNLHNPYLKIGELVTFREFYENTHDEDLKDCYILTIERTNTSVKLSDYVFAFVADLGVKHVFAVCGGAAMHLVDSLGKSKNLNYVATHHEQAAAMAAEGYARISGKPGVALVTSGPGGTNTITGVYGAWIDSIPVIFISGQVNTNTLIGKTGLRQFGIQEADIIKLVKPITKYAVTVKNPAYIKYHLQKALHLAVTGRPGPVWIDIPLDIQSKLIDYDALVTFNSDELRSENWPNLLDAQVADCIALLYKAKRPVMISGYGIRLAKAENEFLQLVEKLRIPLVSSWTTSDLIDTDHELYIGRSGIIGDRAANFTVQNSDLLLIIGSRMSIPQVGYNYETFAREAKKIMVDIDEKEIRKPSIRVDLPIIADAKKFMIEMLRQLEQQKVNLKVSDWIEKCRRWKAGYPVILPEYKENKETVNSFYFMGILSEKLDKSAIVVTDMGTSFTCTMQTFKVKRGQRLFTSSGLSPMGFGLPGSIGSCFASNRKKVICITGDGGLQMNIQELQTVVHHNLPIIIFVLNNGGYLTIKLMQQNHFGRYVGSDKDSGLSCPDIIKVAGAYGIKTERIANHDELHAKIDGILAEPGPLVCEIIMSENQPLIPRASSIKKPDGTIISRPLEDMYPFLSREELLKNIIVKPVEVLSE